MNTANPNIPASAVDSNSQISSPHTHASRVVEVQDLTRIYGLKPNQWGLTPSQRAGRPTAANPGYVAVDGINFHVNEGEVFGLLGTNGAGKSSTLEVLEGLAKPYSGTVRLFGMDPVKNRGAIRPLTATMLQDGGLPRELKVKEALTMWAGISSHARPIEEVLDDVDLTHRMNNKIGGLSGGEQRRLDLACVLLSNPRLIFLDEPTTGLDPESRANTWDLLERLKAKGVTMILTTHYLEEAERLCDRIAIMHRGRIQMTGTHAELVATQPAEISFRIPFFTGDAQSSTAEVPPLVEGLDGTVLRDGDLVKISTTDLQQDTLKVLSWAQSNGLTLSDFHASAASLETVFMNIAGRDFHSG